MTTPPPLPAKKNVDDLSTPVMTTLTPDDAGPNPHLSEDPSLPTTKSAFLRAAKLAVFHELPNVANIQPAFNPPPDGPMPGNPNPGSEPPAEPTMKSSHFRAAFLISHLKQAAWTAPMATPAAQTQTPTMPTVRINRLTGLPFGARPLDTVNLPESQAANAERMQNERISQGVPIASAQDMRGAQRVLNTTEGAQYVPTAQPRPYAGPADPRRPQYQSSLDNPASAYSPQAYQRTQAAIDTGYARQAARTAAQTPEGMTPEQQQRFGYNAQTNPGGIMSRDQIHASGYVGGTGPSGNYVPGDITPGGGRVTNVRPWQGQKIPTARPAQPIQPAQPRGSQILGGLFRAPQAPKAGPRFAGFRR